MLYCELTGLCIRNGSMAYYPEKIGRKDMIQSLIEKWITQNSMEIEKKFLVKELPDLSKYPKKEISQAYISVRPVIRVRRSDEKRILTIKSGGLMQREEFELFLSEEEYENLLEKAEGLVIEKTRYLIPEKDGLTIELDVFHGVLDGLIMAEVEFPSPEAAGSYIPADFFGREVTDDPAYQNSSMTKMNPAEIAGLIAKSLS